MEWKKNWKIFIYQRNIFRIQSDKTPIGLHGEGRMSNLSDRGPWLINHIRKSMSPDSVKCGYFLFKKNKILKHEEKLQ